MLKFLFQANNKKGFYITDKCVGCGICAKKCPSKAISGNKRERYRINYTKCEHCGKCWTVCPKCAIRNPFGFYREKQNRIFKAHITESLCACCHNCLLNCPNEAIYIKKRSQLSKVCAVREEVCLGCGTCISGCHTGALSLKSGENNN